MALLSNSLGDQILYGTVTRSTFAGPPILAIGAGLTGGDARWTRAVAFASGFGAPLVGAPDSSELDFLSARLRDLRKFWSSDGNSPAPMWVSGARATPTFMGPILHVPATGGGAEDTLVDDAWLWASDFARVSAHHKYRFGMFAVSAHSPRPSPPIYKLPANATSADFAELTRLWRAPPEPSSTDYATLQQLEADRPGASRYYHPSLLSWLYLEAP
jgi:hypothetical protein